MVSYPCQVSHMFSYWSNAVVLTGIKMNQRWSCCFSPVAIIISFTSFLRHPKRSTCLILDATKLLLWAFWLNITWWPDDSAHTASLGRLVQWKVTLGKKECLLVYAFEFAAICISLYGWFARVLEYESWTVFGRGIWAKLPTTLYIMVADSKFLCFSKLFNLKCVSYLSH